MHVPERWAGEILLRADFRAFYAMELAWDQPLAVVLGESLGDDLTSWYRLAWCLAATWRASHPRLEWEAFLDLLPEAIAPLAALMVALVDEAIAPICPVSQEPPSKSKPKRVRWSQRQFEGSLVGLTGEPWWLSTFRVQQALLWEYARHHDPEGKSGRAMAQWEIDEADTRNLAMLFGMGARIDGIEAVRS